MSYPDDDDDLIPDTGAVFTFGRSRFAENIANKFWIKNDQVVKIACGDEHSAVITDRGRLYVFGSNDWGQLGLGHTKASNKPSFVKVLKPEKVTQVACGRSHTLVCCESGKLFSFGCNEDGQLGNGEKENESFPKEIEQLFGLKVRHLSCGTYHSVALTEEGSVYVWGNNSEGQVGVGDEMDNPVPQLLTLDADVVSVSCGYYHTALVTSDGVVYTFGEEELGKLGLFGSQLSNTTRPQPVATLDDDKYMKVSCGARHTVAVTERGRCYSWGDGSQGQLGHGTRIQEVTEPKQIERLSELKCVDVSCGESHTSVVTDSGKIFTFGDGRHGKLAQGDECFSNLFEPTFVRRFKGFTVQSVVCGGCHMLVRAMRSTNYDEDEEDGSLMASISSRFSLQEANQTLKPGAMPFPKVSPRDKRRLKSDEATHNRSLNLNGSLNDSMGMSSRTLPELKLDRNRLPKIPGLDISGDRNTLRKLSDESFNEADEDLNHKPDKNKGVVAGITFDRGSKKKTKPYGRRLNSIEEQIDVDDALNRNVKHKSEDDEGESFDEEEIHKLNIKKKQRLNRSKKKTEESEDEYDDEDDEEDIVKVKKKLAPKNKRKVKVEPKKRNVPKKQQKKRLVEESEEEGDEEDEDMEDDDKDYDEDMEDEEEEGEDDGEEDEDLEESEYEEEESEEEVVKKKPKKNVKSKSKTTEKKIEKKGKGEIKKNEKPTNKEKAKRKKKIEAKNKKKKIVESEGEDEDEDDIDEDDENDGEDEEIEDEGDEDDEGDEEKNDEIDGKKKEKEDMKKNNKNKNKEDKGSGFFNFFRRNKKQKQTAPEKTGDEEEDSTTQSKACIIL